MPQFRLHLQTALLLLALGLVLAWWLARGLPVMLVEPAAALQPLPCVSYAPFRRPGINPFNHAAVVTPAQIEEDLRLLKTITNCVRTYGLGQGLDALPAVATRLGMRVKLGAWLTRDAAHNQRELARALALAHEFKGTVELLIVGNEVLLRRELLPAELARYLAHARQHSPVPVTYADVWEFWLRHAALAAEVDVVTVHILPYWEDQPVAVRDAVAHLRAVDAQVRARFAGKPVWVGETGWPAAGRQRAGAVPGRVEQARFVRELLVDSAAAPLDYNFIEAFDQPWKRAFEGAMGGYWGWFDAAGAARVALRRAVTEDARWWRGWLGAGLGAVLGLMLGALAGAPPARWTRVVPLTLTGALLGALAPVQSLAVQQWDRTPLEWGGSLLLGALGNALAVVVALCLTAGMTSSRVGRAGAALRLAVLFCAASVVLTLLFDARYRPFQWWWFAAPAASLLAWRVCGPLWPLPCPEERLLARLLALCSLAVALQEGWRNSQALAFCGLMLVLAAAVGWPSRTSTSSASSAAGAHSPAV